MTDTNFCIDRIKMTVYNTVMIENFVTIMERHNEFTPVIEIESGRYFNDKKELCKFVGDVSIDGIKYRYATRREIDFVNDNFRTNAKINITEHINYFIKNTYYRGIVMRTKVYNDYIEFCYTNKYVRVNRNSLYRELEKNGFGQIRRAEGRYIVFP